MLQWNAFSIAANYTYLIYMPSSITPGTVVTSQVFDIAREVLHVAPPGNNFSPLDEITSTVNAVLLLGLHYWNMVIEDVIL